MKTLIKKSFNPLENELKIPIKVTQPALPPLEEFVPYLEKIWESHWITNNGDLHKQFEKELAQFLGVKYVSLFANGTLALITALQVLRITGEVITTPFSFVATTHSISWNNLTPVFADIDRKTFNLDPERIEEAITPKTTAIMPVHVYGNPCNVEAIKEIADNYGLKVIYDACHTFGEKYHGKSILSYGDLSVLSFHATKIFTTFEGGAIICHDEATKKRIDFLKNFGFVGETSVIGIGINSKMNEFQAALGLLQLSKVKDYIKKRREITELYKKQLSGIEGISIPLNYEDYDHSCAYFPILVDKEKYGKTRDQLNEYLKQKNIFCRRYFYPLISEFPVYRKLESAQPENLKVAKTVSERILCLPIYPELELKKIDKICRYVEGKI